MKKTIKILSILMVMALILTGCSSGSSEVVATVNGSDIYKDIFDKTAAKVGKEYEMIFGEEIWSSDIGNGKTFKDTFKDEILNVMIMQSLVAAEAVKEGITVSQEEIESEVKSYLDYISNVPGYTDYLKTNNIDEEFLKEHFRLNLIFEKYRSKVMSQSEITDEEVKVYYQENIKDYTKEEIKASHILLGTLDEFNQSIPENEKSEKLELAKEILRRAKAGEDFALLAKEYSDDTASGVNGGDLGYFPRGIMVAEFEEAAFALDSGQVSDIVETAFGYHIIKVFDKKSEVITLEDEKENIIARMQYDMYNKIVEELESGAKIEKFPEIMNK